MRICWKALDEIYQTTFEPVCTSRLYRNRFLEVTTQWYSFCSILLVLLIIHFADFCTALTLEFQQDLVNFVITSIFS